MRLAMPNLLTTTSEKMTKDESLQKFPKFISFPKLTNFQHDQ